MMWSNVLRVAEALDDPGVDGARVGELLRRAGVSDPQVTRVRGDRGATDFVRAVIPGSHGRGSGGRVPTLGVIGRLGGIGARPKQIGLVSDGDGAIVPTAVAATLATMHRRGDVLPGDVIVATHICPNAPIQPHDPVPFMSAPVAMAGMNSHELDPSMDAVLSVDTTKGNRVCNNRGFAISPTVKEGWILRVSESLLDVQQRVTGALPVVLPITTQDITPYGNGVFHINSILQPAVATSAPVVGVAITTETLVAGSATGATDLASVEAAGRFCVEVAKDFGDGRCVFYDTNEFERLVGLYGPMTKLQTGGAEVPGS